jgi:hypothetical protein
VVVINVYFRRGGGNKCVFSDMAIVLNVCFRIW